MSRPLVVTPPLVVSVVVNKCHGGFSLSAAASEALLRRKGIAYQMVVRHEGSQPVPVMNDHPYRDAWECCERHDADLVAVVREMGRAADGEYARLEVVDFAVVPEIQSHDGKETASMAAFCTQ